MTKTENLLLILIVLIALCVRLYGLQWDNGQHLHPDERFLSMVAAAIKPPQTITQYFDTKISPLNPGNNNFSFYVYGTFPLFLTKYISMVFALDSYDGVTVVGRILSALFDTVTVFVIFLLGKKLYTTRIGLLSSFFYATCVLPIQLSHFFAVDTFLVFFTTISAYFLILFFETTSSRFAVLSGISFGFALACKVSAILFVIPFLLGGAFFFTYTKVKTLRAIFFFALASFIVFRIMQPYAFLSLGDFHINPAFVDNLKQLKDLDNPDLLFPPGIQWINAPKFIFPLYNLFFYGMGISLGSISLLGFILSLFNVIHKQKSFYKKVGILTILACIVVIFVYQGIQFAMPLRYFYPFYPFLCICAGWFLLWLSHKFSFGTILSGIVIIASLVWTVCFLSIYTRPHSRITATNWIYANIFRNSFILSEYWDDPLPLLLSPQQVGIYQTDQLHVFDRESSEKWDTLYALLIKGDYIVLSSNRTYKPIQAHREIYPQTARYYDALFSGQLGFMKIYEGTSYPSFFGIAINDDRADETFTVYDHPKVLIYKKYNTITHEQFNTLLGIYNTVK